MKDAIADELQHRMGNLFSVVMTIARQTARHAPSLDAFLEIFTARIDSLWRTQKALAGGSWDGMTLRKLAEQELQVTPKPMATR